MKTVGSRIAPLALCAAVVLGLWGAAGAQQPSLPDIINVDVTFYDFRSDRSNPEFEQPHGGGRRLGMVANTLDPENKPQLGSSPYRNYGIAHWFRSWETYRAGPYSRGTNMAPVYTPTPNIRQFCSGANSANCDEWGATVRYVGDQNVGHDTSFKNIVIPGQLPFRLTDARTGMYEYNRSERNPNAADRQFFPLDGRGFGNEWPAGINLDGRQIPNRNFSFTMELDFQFQARSDMVFNFEGDDDVWVFIDNRLVLDIGGIHSPIRDSFRLADVSHVTVGGYHTLRVFYAERHSDGSNILIQTNIVAPPASMSIDTVGNNGNGVVSGTISKPADKSMTLYSVVYDDNGVVLQPGQYECSHVTWTVGGRNVGTGCSIEIADSIAGTLAITSTYNNRQDPPMSRTISMDVKALPPTQVTIQLSPNLYHKTAADGALSEDVYFNPGEDTARVYAVLRDQYGNPVAFAEPKTASGANDWSSQGSAQWQSDNTEVATLNPANGPNALVRKEFMGEGTEARIIVSYTICGGTLGSGRCQTLADTVEVGSKSTGAIAIGPNPFTPGVTTVQDTYRDKPRTVDFYQNVIRNSGTGTGSGVLIAVDAPKPLQESPGSTGTAGGKAFGKVVIYDAVGNVVRMDRLYQASGAARSYGYVWDGKNSKGRTVGPGTYLVRVTGRESGPDGKGFRRDRKVGVKK